MSRKEASPRGISITLRTALWSWGVTLVTLLFFAAAIIPQQKQTFQENLESKAHGAAVSLREIAAGAVVNEDFGAVVDHCKEMLRGDSALDYLIVTKNDGFSLIHDRSGWRSEAKAGREWRPVDRAARSGIGIVPLFNRRVFYYSQPFDYSGIQWGWIHVGLSLESYDRSVAAVYNRTIIAAIGCILLSLAASAFYARHLVRPILTLRNVVQRVASGDLDARAEIERRDEVVTLAGSVNVMTEALLRRDRILESVRFAAQQFLTTADWHAVIPSVLGKIGQAAGVSRAYVFTNKADNSGALLGFQSHEWAAPGIKPQIDNQALQGFAYHGSGFARWMEVLEKGQILSGLVAQMPVSERAVLEAQAIRSLIVIPIHVDGAWWGFLGLDDCLHDRVWTESERDSLRAAADMLGATLARQRTQDALIEAKDTLEARVKERTQELQEQVVAKDRAHAQLAETQRKLIDASRRAGMAEVATSVLHNVGNVLNSVNVSVHLMHDQLAHSKTATLSRIVLLLESHRANLGEFLTSDPKGSRVVELLSQLATVLKEERTLLADEINSLLTSVGHIKEIVSMQQSYATVAGFTEDLPIINLVEDAIRMQEDSFLRHGIILKREFENDPLVRVDKHKVLQILVNLFSNASDALKTAGPEKALIVGITLNGPSRVKVMVRDNGIGIAPENLTRIFGHGFTTKKDGHGFGLHSGALAAREMGGSLHALSSGAGSGATFVLELPTATEDEREQKKSKRVNQ